MQKASFFHMRIHTFACCFLLLACSNNAPSEKMPVTAARPGDSLVTAPTPPPLNAPAASLSAAPESSKPVPNRPKLPEPVTIPRTATPPITPLPAPAGQPEGTAVTAPDHAIWNALLGQYVSAAGKVNYKAFKADQATLDRYLKILADHPPQATWSRAETMAYWINAYNAFTIDLMLDHYPVSSILKLDGGKTWDVKRITLGGNKYSLNQLENDILRPQFKDARIHFAINCAARSCPPLLNKAFTAENLETTLEARTRAFVNNPQFNTLGPGTVKVSKIFDWYSADFGDLKQFLNRYATPKIDAVATVTFQDNDWSLND